MKILVSACLLGLPCRYDGKSKEYPINEILAKHTLVPFCPECYGGLPTPREPSEIVGDRVISSSGLDVTEQYKKGSALAVRLCEMLGIRFAILKEKSPSCGKRKIYDGSFSGHLTDGDGMTVRALEQIGVKVYGESELQLFLNNECKDGENP